MTTEERRAPRINPTAWLKQRILADQGGLCLACRCVLDASEIDHVIPLALGGGNERRNLAALCRTCHRDKTKLDLKRIAKADQLLSRSGAPGQFAQCKQSRYRRYQRYRVGPRQPG